MTNESGCVIVSAHCPLNIENYYQEPFESSIGLDILLTIELDTHLVKIKTILFTFLKFLILFNIQIISILQAALLHYVRI